MARPPVVASSKDLTRALRQGHPWVYRDALAAAPDLPAGTLVAVADRRGREIAFGYWDKKGPIAVRVLDLAPIADAAALVRRRLEEALALRRARLDLRATNAFRWVHGEADRLPGIHIDVYASVVALRFDGEGSRAFYAHGNHLQSMLFACGGELGLRKVVDREARGRHPEEVEVRENGVRFLVDVGRGQKGGLFLDQRENRQAVAQQAAGKSLLNLFGYTGGFSLHAALAGAARTDTVDIAGPAIAAARRNFALNRLDPSRAGFHVADVFAFLERAVAAGRTWDIVVSDPPSFAPSQRSLPSARKSYLRLHRLAALVAGRGGLLCAASCSSHLGRSDFLALVEAGVREAGRRFALRSYTGAGVDHPTLPAFPEGDYLKFAVGEVR